MRPDPGVRSNLRLTAVGLLFVLFAAACSSSETSSNYVAVEPAASSPTADGAAGSGSTVATASMDAAAQDPVADARGVIQGRPVPATTTAEIVDLWNRFLADRSQILVGEADLDLLDTSTTPSGRSQVADAATHNRQLVAADELTGLTRLLEWSNVEMLAEAAPDRVRFRDCTERHRVNVLGRESVVFVTNVVDAVLTDAGWRIDHVDAVQNGVIGLTNDDLGCVPPSFADRALATATDAVDLAAGYADDPDSAGSIPSIFQDRARETLERALIELQLQGLRRSPDERLRLEVLGMDLNRPDFTVVVEVCRQYPNGRSYVTDTGTTTAPDLAPGTSVAERLFVLVEPTAAAPTLDAVIDLTTDRVGCWA